MSFKASFGNLDIQTLSQKVRRLEYWFEQGCEHITDERLDNYNLLKKRIEELLSSQTDNNNDVEENLDTLNKSEDKQIVTIEVNGTKVIGKITRLERFYMEVEILYPYVNWKNYRVISGMGRGTPNHFLKTYKERSEQLLLESYKKLKIIDKSIDRFVKVYDDMLVEIKLASMLENNLVRDRIVGKLNDWFYDNFIFTSSVTGMIATISDKPQIEQILKKYRSQKRKIYLI